MPSETPATLATDLINIHGQTRLVEQAYPAFRSPYLGTNSLPGTGAGRETSDATLYIGVRESEGLSSGLDQEIEPGDEPEDRRALGSA
jgi:high affinity Mn2+ porin